MLISCKFYNIIKYKFVKYIVYNDNDKDKKMDFYVWYSANKNSLIADKYNTYSISVKAEGGIPTHKIDYAKHLYNYISRNN
jgi:hypothetical protein